MGKIRVMEVGERYGCFEVIQRRATAEKWIRVRCDCGVTTIVHFDTITRKPHSTSCGSLDHLAYRRRSDAQH